MEGIIYVAHGSQKNDKNQMMIQFYEALKKGRSETKQQLAFLEKHPDSLTTVALKLISEGVNKLLIVPLLLFSAMHKEEDIVEEVAAIQQLYPNVSVCISETFGQEKEVIDVLLDNIQKETAICQLPLTTPVLLVAHGSSNYPKPAIVVKAVAKKLSNESGLAVSVGLLYGELPYLSIAKDLLKENKQLLVVPFFLFDGHLLDKIKRELATLQESLTEEKELIYTSTLSLEHSMVPGIHRLMKQATVDG